MHTVHSHDIYHNADLNCLNIVVRCELYYHTALNGLLWIIGCLRHKKIKLLWNDVYYKMCYINKTDVCVCVCHTDALSVSCSNQCASERLSLEEEIKRFRDACVKAQRRSLMAQVSLSAMCWGCVRSWTPQWRLCVCVCFSCVSCRADVNRRCGGSGWVSLKGRWWSNTWRRPRSGTALTGVQSDLHMMRVGLCDNILIVVYLMLSRISQKQNTPTERTHDSGVETIPRATQIQ